MSAQIVVSCDGTQPCTDPAAAPRMPCRGAYPSRTTSWTLAVGEAVGTGWSHTEDGDDLCPACTRNAR